MDWQLLIVGGAVALAIGYVARSSWRTWFGASGTGGCASACGGCSGATEQPTQEERRRIALPRV